MAQIGVPAKSPMANKNQPRCTACGGVGRIEPPPPATGFGRGALDTWPFCERCEGTGWIRASEEEKKIQASINHVSRTGNMVLIEAPAVKPLLVLAERKAMTRGWKRELSPEALFELKRCCREDVPVDEAAARLARWGMARNRRTVLRYMKACSAELARQSDRGDERQARAMVGGIIRRIRQRSRQSQGDFGNVFVPHLPQSVVSGWESGSRIPSRGAFARLLTLAVGSEVRILKIAARSRAAKGVPA